MPDATYIRRTPTISKRGRFTSASKTALPVGHHHSPEQIATECLEEAGNDLERACALAGRRARGAKLRLVHVAIGNALLRAPAN
jgi:hypothetical protein